MNCQQELDELRRRAAAVVNEWHQDDLSSDAVSYMAELIPAELTADRCPDCGSTNLAYGRNLTGCSDCGWHEEE